MNKITFPRVFGGTIILFVLTVLVSLLTNFRLFSSEGFVPRALCGEWTSGLIALHNFSDFFIWASYLTIPIVLVSFAKKRANEIPFPHLFWLFGLFIIACGTTHLIDIILFYEPVYRLSGVVKLFTAAASIGTVFALVKVLPVALAMRSPESLHIEIEERKKIEEQLRNRDKQFANAQKIAKIGSWEWDIKSNHVSWSDELYRIYGYQPFEVEITYESFLEKVIPEDRNNTKANIQKAYETGQPFSFYERIMQPDGSVRILYSRGEVLADKEGNPYKMIGVCHDVTDAKKQEEELRRAKDELELRVEERTRELIIINNTLQLEIIERKKAIEKTETALKEKEILLKEVHHRVKNNLQIISSLINLQSNQVNNKEMLNFFTQTNNRIRSIALIHEKLYKSLDISSIDFEEYLSDLVNNFYDAFKTITENVSFKIEIEKIFVSIDNAVSLALIINEIASNSFKYAFPNNRKGEVYISLKRLDDEKYVLVVRDDGVGLPDGIDFNNTNTLGLKLINVLVQKLEGTIKINNIKGTEYIITLPNLL